MASRRTVNPLGYWLDRLIKETGMPRSEFCRFAGVSESWVASIVNRGAEPKWVWNIRRIVTALGCEYGDLFRL